jgi:hypothetical protein
VPSPVDTPTDLEDCPCKHMPMRHFSMDDMMLSPGEERMVASINDNMHLLPTSRTLFDELTAEEVAVLTGNLLDLDYDPMLTTLGEIEKEIMAWRPALATILEENEDEVMAWKPADSSANISSHDLDWIERTFMTARPPLRIATHVNNDDTGQDTDITLYSPPADWEKYGTAEWFYACPTPRSPTSDIGTSSSCSTSSITPTDYTKIEMDWSPRALRADNNMDSNDFPVDDPNVYPSILEGYAYASDLMCAAENHAPCKCTSAMSVPESGEFADMDTDLDMLDDEEEEEKDDDPGWPDCHYCGKEHDPCAACFESSE